MRTNYIFQHNYCTAFIISSNDHRQLIRIRRASIRNVFDRRASERNH